MSGLRLVPWLLIIVWLAGCGGKPAARPSRPGVSRGASGAAYAPAGSGGWNDDTSRSQGSRYRDSEDSVPEGPPPDVSRLPEPVPKFEPRSIYGNKSPYTVNGQTYRVLPSAHGYVERGIASYYGSKFHRFKTSNFEEYDMYAFSAASKVLPLPSYARVTNLENGKNVIVRINDRGPFAENRLIDLSYATAVRIGIYPKGTGLVEVRAIDPGVPLQELPPAPVSKPTGGAGPSIYLQVGAFSDMNNVQRVAARLRQANFAPVRIVDTQLNGRTVHRVQVGPLRDVETADEVTAKIESMGLPRAQVAVN